jgi:cytochrome P450
MDTSAGSRPAAPHRVTDPARVRAILADSRYTVPDPGRGAPPGTMHWLRQNVARFSNGADHARRRGLAEQLLRGLDPRLLRARARDESDAVIDRAAGRPFDAIALVARRVPGLVLAGALGAADPEQAVGQLAAVAAAYLPGGADPASADGSVARLTALLPAGPAELMAARIGLLIQAYAATAGLIGTSVADGLAAAGLAPAADLVARALRGHPPVLVTGRVTPAGQAITLDLASAAQDDDAAAPLAFGYGPRACPGAAQACALAEGAAEPLLARCRPTGAQISYPAPPAVQVPERLEVAERGSGQGNGGSQGEVPPNRAAPPGIGPTPNPDNARRNPGRPETGAFRP